VPFIGRAKQEKRKEKRVLIKGVSGLKKERLHADKWEKAPIVFLNALGNNG